MPGVRRANSCTQERCRGLHLQMRALGSYKTPAKHTGQQLPAGSVQPVDDMGAAPREHTGCCNCGSRQCQLDPGAANIELPTVAAQGSQTRWSQKIHVDQQAVCGAAAAGRKATASR